MVLLQLLRRAVVPPDLHVVGQENLPVTVDPVEHLQKKPKNHKYFYSGWSSNKTTPLSTSPSDNRTISVDYIEHIANNV